MGYSSRAPAGPAAKSSTVRWVAALLVLVVWAGPAAGADAFRVADYSFKAPAEWERVQTSSQMRKAQFIVRNADGGDDGLVIFFHFGPGQGGSPQANIRRWYSQFTEPNDKLGARVREDVVGGRKLYDFRATGTLIVNRQGTKAPGYTLLAAIIESPAGNVFVRLAAPKALAAKHEERFRGMIEDAMRGRQK